MSSSVVRVGVVGVGTIGLALVRTLVDQGAGVNAHDIDQDARKRAAVVGAETPGSSARVAQVSDVVLMSLPGEEASMAALEGPAGVLEGARAGAVVVDTSTISPRAARESAKACSAAGIAHLDAPISGRPPRMTMFVGGDSRAFELAQPVLDSIATEVHYLGGSGNGAATKLANQFSLLINLISGIEAVAFAADAGVDPRRAVVALRGGYGASRALEIVEKFVLAGDYAGNGSSLQAMNEDMAKIDQLWGEAPLWSETRRLYHETARVFGAGADFWSVARVLKSKLSTTEDSDGSCLRSL